MKRTIALVLGILAGATAAADPPSDFFWLDDYLADHSTDCMTGNASDITAALQEALDDVTSDGGTLVLSNGETCAFDTILEINGGANFVIEGNGATLQFTSTSPGGNSGGIRIQNSSDFEIRNLTIVGDKPSFSPTCAGIGLIHLVSVQNAVFVNTTVLKGNLDGFIVRAPISSEEEDYSRNVRFVGCTANENCRHGWGIALGDNIQILGGTANRNSGEYSGSLPISSGVRIEPNSLEGEDPNKILIRNVLISGMTLIRNAGNGIHLGTGGGGGINTEEVRIVDNVIVGDPDPDSGDYLGAVRIAAGRDILFRGNQIVNHSEALQDAVLEVHWKADRVAIDGNRFEDITAPTDLIQVQAGTNVPEAIHITGNQFVNIDPSTNQGSVAVIFHEGTDAVIADNQMTHVTTRAIEVLGDRAIIRSNVLKGMKANVVYLDSEDTEFSGNSIHLETAGTSANTDAVVYTASSSIDNLVRSNSLFCTGTTQKGFYFSQTLQVFTDNSVNDCSTPGWHSGQASLAHLDTDNRRY